VLAGVVLIAALYVVLPVGLAALDRLAQLD